MCRNIRTLFNFEPPATEEEIRAASLQFVRKLSGFTRPSKANEAAFERAVDDVTAVAKTLIDLTEEPDAMTHPKGSQIRISRQEISRIVGCSREMVGRVLKQLEDQGMITVTGKTIVVLGTR